MPTILSRFDMIFIVKDEHDEARDVVSLSILISFPLQYATFLGLGSCFILAVKCGCVIVFIERGPHLYVDKPCYMFAWLL